VDPESVAWLDSDDQLRPRAGLALQEEARAIQTRHETIGDAMRAVRALRRRELLRLAFGAVLGTLTIEELAEGSRRSARSRSRRPCAPCGARSSRPPMKPSTSR
jgi:hypothetical protein